MAVKKTGTSKKAPEFELALKELEQLVERMEKGERPLEDSLKDFERGVELTRICQQSLKAAEQKVQLLLEQNGQAELVDFEEDELS